MSAETFLQIGGALLGGLILFFLVRGAVKSGTEDIKKQLSLQNNLKLKELHKQGVSTEELQDLVNKASAE